MLSLQKAVRESDRQPVVLDHVRAPQLTLSLERVHAMRNQVAALDRLMYGMRFCVNCVSDQESKLQRVASEEGLRFAGLGLTGFKEYGVEEGIIYSCFDWYAINVCRFFQLRAFISDQLDGAAERVKKAKEYRRTVCGNVNTFRDKIAAHFAETDPWLRPGPQQDNLADLYTSTMLTIGFHTGRFRAGAALGGVVVGEDMIEPQHDIAWSLTEFHETVVLPRVTGSRANKNP